MVGDKIKDYEILEQLGKGGFAHVYRARCRRTGEFVAIKIIDKALMVSAGMIGRVRQEVTIHSRLKHPAILQLYTFFEDDHYVYLVLELAHYGELAKHFKLGTHGLSEKAAGDIFRQVVSGVMYLHTHNIIHRDLSLNNLLLVKNHYVPTDGARVSQEEDNEASLCHLLLTKGVNVKIADFGLATQLNAPDEKHVTMCGTPNYISPEVASRELHGLPADVWGLGCMLYTLLVGSPPFHTQHVKTTLNKVINADYKIPAELSIQAQDLLQKLLCKDPTKRITLKGIMEHPFVNNRQDFSRDSGFLTTLHSTQHSNKTRSEIKNNYECLTSSKDQLSSNIVCSDVEMRPFNVFMGLQENISRNSHENFGASYNDDKGSRGFTDARNSKQICFPERKFDSACSAVPECIQRYIQPADAISNSALTENKENVSKTPNVNSNSLGVPPLCAERLPNLSHRTRNAILKIEPSAVIVEFIKKKGKDREEKVVEICKISKDGMKIIIYNCDKGKLLDVDHNPSPDEVFTYHNLPQKHWKKYLYASRFVDLVKAKTPKITLYSNMAKCQLMENGTDMELFFYNGEKVTFSPTEGLKIIDKNLKTHYNLAENPELKYLTDHFEECSNRLNRVQSALSCIPDECFPLIIGKRPMPNVNTVASPHQASVNINTPLLNIGSFHRTGACSSQATINYNIL